MLFVKPKRSINENLKMLCTYLNTDHYPAGFDGNRITDIVIVF